MATGQRKIDPPQFASVSIACRTCFEHYL